MDKIQIIFLILFDMIELRFVTDDVDQTRFEFDNLEVSPIALICAIQQLNEHCMS